MSTILVIRARNAKFRGCKYVTLPSVVNHSSAYVVAMLSAAFEYWCSRSQNHDRPSILRISTQDFLPLLPRVQAIAARAGPARPAPRSLRRHPSKGGDAVCYLPSLARARCSYLCCLQTGWTLLHAPHRPPQSRGPRACDVGWVRPAVVQFSVFLFLFMLLFLYVTEATVQEYIASCAIHLIPRGWFGAWAPKSCL
jgi:hypothetical protein